MPPPVIDPEALKHIEEAKRNYERYQAFIDNSLYFDWAIVTLFYSALHLVQAFAVDSFKKGRTREVPKDHVDRDRYINSHLVEINHDYDQLKNACNDARYDLVRWTREEIEEFHDSNFMEIKKKMVRRGITWETPPSS